MKKRTLAALLGTLTALSSLAPTMAQPAEIRMNPRRDPSFSLSFITHLIVAVW